MQKLPARIIAYIKSNSRQDRSERLFFSFILLACCLVLWPYRHFSGDDAYITFRYVQNMVAGHGYAYNVQEPSYGSTSPLWVFLLALVNAAGLPIVSASHLLGFLFAVLALTTFWLLCRYYIHQVWLRLAAVLLMGLDPWFIRWCMSGMENGLALFLLIAVLLLRQRRTGRGNAICAVCCGLAILTRPEMVLFTILLFTDALLFDPKICIRRTLLNVLIVVLIVTPWLLYAHATFGSIVPDTIRAKISSNHLAAAVRIVLYLLSFWVFEGLGVVLAFCLEGRMLAAQMRDPQIWRRWMMPVAWSIALPCFYIVGGAPISARYLMFALPCYLLIGVKAWEILLQSDGMPRWIVPLPLIRSRRPAAVSALCALALGLVIWTQYRYCWFITRWQRGMDPRIIAMAEWIRLHSDKNDVVAADQIGVMGYYSSRYILDVAGLVSPEVIPYKKAADPNAVWDYVYQRKADYLFLVDDQAVLQTHGPAYRNVELVFSSRIMREGGFYPEAEITYYLYRTHWKSNVTAMH